LGENVTASLVRGAMENLCLRTQLAWLSEVGLGERVRPSSALGASGRSGRTFDKALITC